MTGSKYLSCWCFHHMRHLLQLKSLFLAMQKVPIIDILIYSVAKSGMSKHNRKNRSRKKLDAKKIDETSCDSV